MPFQLSKQDQGKVFWVTGLAGAGKTTLAGLLVSKLRETEPSVVFLDGDVMRDVFGGSAGHSSAERLVLAQQYASLCRMLSRQGLTVVCATISMFHEVRRWNRQNLPGYCEIYLKVPMSVLEDRDQKGLYRGARNGEVDNVIGVNAPFEEPDSPDIMLENNGDRDPETVLDELLDKLANKINGWRNK